MAGSPGYSASLENCSGPGRPQQRGAGAALGAAMSLIYFAITLFVSWLFYTLMTKDDLN